MPRPSLITRAVAYGRDILRSRRLILELTHREFRSRHLGSGLGLLWAFMHPGVMMAIYCLVFTCFMHPGPIHEILPSGEHRVAPFLLWLLAGLVPWFLISDMLSSAVSVINDNRFLVKKVVFNVSLLPIIRLLTNLPVHLFMLMAITGILWAEGFRPCWHTVQVLYFLFAAVALGLGWSLLVSAVVPFLKDVGQVVAVIVQILFWVTPLIWPAETLTGKWEKNMVYLIPTTYVVQGYRASMVYHEWFWMHWLATVYFWVWTIILLCVGGVVFARLRTHFADVL